MDSGGGGGGGGGGRGQMHPPFEGLPLCVLSKSVHRAWICTRNSSLVPKP